MWPIILFAVLSADPPASAIRQASPPGIPFECFTTTDSFGRTVTFYLSREGNAAPQKLPLALIIQGSGCQSIFQKRGEQISGGLQNLLLRAAAGRFHVLAVEKPGVVYLQAPNRPGSAQGCSDEFLTEHTLPRWKEANMAALRAAWTLPAVNPSKTLVIGHSEGGIVAAAIAATVREVTHVASLSGGGPTQLFSLAESRAQVRPEDKAGDAERRVAKLYEEWSAVLQNPHSATEMWLGHPYRRWSSFLASSVTAELLKADAKIFLGQGEKDAAVPVTAHLILVAELHAHGKLLTAVLVKDADHGFRRPTELQGAATGFQEVFSQVTEWFLKE